MPSMKLVVTAMVAAVASISGRCLDIRDMSLTRPSHESNKSIFGEVANLSPNSGAGAPSELRTGFFDDDYASEEDWKRYTSKGHTLMCALASNDENAGKIIGDTRNPPSAASEFQGTLEQEMKDYYWHDTNPSTYSCKLDTHWKMSYAMQSLGLNGKPVSENGDIQGYRTEHWDPDKEDDNGNRIPAINQWYKVGNKELRVSLVLTEHSCEHTINANVRPRRRTTSLESTGKAEVRSHQFSPTSQVRSLTKSQQFLTSSSRVLNPQPARSGMVANATRSLTSCPDSVPSPTSCGAFGAAATPMSKISATSS